MRFSYILSQYVQSITLCRIMFSPVTGRLIHTIPGQTKLFSYFGVICKLVTPFPLYYILKFRLTDAIMNDHEYERK